MVHVNVCVYTYQSGCYLAKKMETYDKMVWFGPNENTLAGKPIQPNVPWLHELEEGGPEETTFIVGG